MRAPNEFRLEIRDVSDARGRRCRPMVRAVIRRFDVTSAVCVVYMVDYGLHCSLDACAIEHTIVLRYRQLEADDEEPRWPPSSTIAMLKSHTPLARRVRLCDQNKKRLLLRRCRVADVDGDGGALVMALCEGGADGRDGTTPSLEAVVVSDVFAAGPLLCRRETSASERNGKFGWSRNDGLSRVSLATTIVAA